MKKYLPASFALLALLSCAGGLHAAVIVDDFNYASFTNDQSYWSRVFSGGDTAFISPAGSAALRARLTQTEHTTSSTTPTYSVIVSSPSDDRYDFFSSGYTVGIDGLSITTANLNLSQAYLRIGLTSSATRQFSADDAMTMRIRYNDDGLGGLLLFGYKINQASVDAENRTGVATTSGALDSFSFTGTIQSASFSLNPVSNVGTEYTIGYTVSLTTTDNTFSISGNMLIDQAQWGTGASFLAIESRRNGNAGYNLTGDSDARVTLGAVTYAAIPEPSAFAALAGAAMLGLAATRRRRHI